MQSDSREIPILPRRSGTVPISSDYPTSSHMTSWNPSRLPYQGAYDSYGNTTWPVYQPGYNQDYGRGMASGPRNISMALENLIQMLYSWTQMIDGTYYTWTTSVSMVMSLWERISDLASKCKGLLLAVLRWWFRVFNKRNAFSFIPPLDTSAECKGLNRNQSNILTSNTMGAVGLVLILATVVLSYFKKKKTLSGEIDDKNDVSTDTSHFVKLSPPVFARVIHHFSSETPNDLEKLEEGQLVAITQAPESHIIRNSETSKPNLNSQLLTSQPIWVYGRTRTGEYGLFPSNYVSIIDTQSSA